MSWDHNGNPVIARDNEHTRREMVRVEQDKAGVRQSEDKAAQQAGLIHELKGLDAEPDDRPGQFRIPAEATIPAGWTTAGLSTGSRDGRVAHFRIIRKMRNDVRYGQETRADGSDVQPLPTMTEIKHGQNKSR